MSFFDWIRGKAPKTESLSSEPHADLDWKALEDALTSAIVSQIARFAATHPDEQFYGFALDCNAYYANVLFCLNTPISLEKSARRYAESDDPKKIAHEKKILEWGLGDWAYQGFNIDTPNWSSDVPMLESFAEIPGNEEEFLVTCCKALIRAEKLGAFSVLKTTPDFRSACIDHDEDASTGEKRLDRVRASL